MGRFATRYSQEQRNAIYAAVIDRGLTHRAAIDQAAAGKLGVPPFAITRSSVGYLCREERRRRDTAAYKAARARGIGIEIEEMRDQLLGVARTLTTSLTRRGAKAPADQAIRVARLLQEIAKIDPHSDATRTTRPQGRDGTAEPAPSNSGWLDQLAKTAAQDQPHSTTPTTPDTTHRQTDTVTAPRDTTPETPDHEKTGSPVAARARVIAARRAAATGQ